MKTVLETLAVGFAMFSAIPVPHPEWNEKNMRCALCVFPLVGVVIGLLWWLWAAVCGVLAFPVLLRAAGFCLLPVLVTGGLHMDGFADTSDALASYASPERRQEILKDSHCGAFAIIRLCTYFVGFFALCGSMVPEKKALALMALGFVLSRSVAGCAIATLPLAKHTGLAHTFASSAHQVQVRWILGTVSLLTAAGLCMLGGVAGALMVLAAALVLWHYAWTARTKFGGINGDLSGWFVQRAEFWMLAALTVCQYGEALV